jgi:dienelactone hydrolase
MSCCPPNSWPALAAPTDYIPKGTEKELDNKLPVYEVGGLTAGKSCIIVLPEVFCWEGRLKGICDHFAEQGYYVIMPDIMRGDSISNHSDEAKDAYLKKWGTWSNSESDMQTIFKYLETNGITNIGSVGFCWGKKIFSSYFIIIIIIIIIIITRCLGYI